MTEDAGRFTRDTPVAVVGAGRLGANLAVAMAAAGYRVATVSSRNAEHRSRLAERLPGTEAVPGHADAAAAAGIVFIAVPDDAIELVCEKLPWRPGQAAVHCAGVLSLDVLATADRAGADTGAFHPMQTFPDRDSAQSFGRITIAVESTDAGLRQWLNELADSLGGEPFDISSDQRDAYHASAVMVCGLTAALAGLAADLWNGFGQDRERGLRALAPLIGATAEAIAVRGVPAALTGPYVRGDVTTVKKHLSATQGHSVDVARAYAALAVAGLPLAAEQGSLMPETRNQIETELRAALRDLPRP